MKWNELFCNTFKELRKQIAPEVKKQFDLMLPSYPMIEACRANDFDFFQYWIATGRLTVEQMRHAAQRYLLGKTKSGQPIFWMIDDMLEPLDAHIGNTWMSELLKKREPIVKYWPFSHCLFGLHLLQTANYTDYSPIVSILESEASAAVLSELFPESIWMAYVTTSHLNPDLFSPLQGCNITLYPRTDPSLNTFLFFEELATEVRKLYNIHITVDSILEENATPEQKERCIDLLEFIIEDSA